MEIPIRGRKKGRETADAVVAIGFVVVRLVARRKLEQPVAKLNILHGLGQCLGPASYKGEKGSL